MEEMRNVLKMLVGKPEWKRHFRRTSHGWEDNIKMGLSEIGWEDVTWIHEAWDKDWWWAAVNMVMDLWVQ
jgi:hypothetical protein